MAGDAEQAGCGLKRRSPDEVRVVRASGNEINFEEEIVMANNSTAVSNVIHLGSSGQIGCASAGSGKVDLDIENNREFLELLFAEDAPSIESLIALRNKLWDAGLSPSMGLFWNLVEWSGLVKIKLHEESNAYGAVSEHLGAAILGGPSQPDLLINEVTPVEVKVGPFGAPALKQLQRYMAKYKSDAGVAVGRELLVALPENIRFIKIAFSDASRRYEVVAEQGGAK